MGRNRRWRLATARKHEVAAGVLSCRLEISLRMEEEMQRCHAIKEAQARCSVLEMKGRKGHLHRSCHITKHIRKEEYIKRGKVITSKKRTLHGLRSNCVLFVLVHKFHSVSPPTVFSITHHVGSFFHSRASKDLRDHGS